MDFSTVSVNFNLPSGLMGISALKFAIAFAATQVTSIFAIPSQPLKEKIGRTKLALEVSLPSSLNCKTSPETPVSLVSAFRRSNNHSVTRLRDYLFFNPWPLTLGFSAFATASS